MFVMIDFLTLAHFGQTASDTDTSFFFYMNSPYRKEALF